MDKKYLTIDGVSPYECLARVDENEYFYGVVYYIENRTVHEYRFNKIHADLENGSVSLDFLSHEHKNLHLVYASRKAAYAALILQLEKEIRSIRNDYERL